MVYGCKECDVRMKVVEFFGGYGLRCDGNWWEEVEVENSLMKMELDGEVE